MNILWYLLVWVLFFAFGFAIHQGKENRQLRKALATPCKEEQFPRRFRSITV